MILLRAMMWNVDQGVTQGECRLAKILDVPTQELDAVRISRRYHYRPFAVPKKNGGQRHILAPSPALKALQQRLLHHYLQRLPIHPAATAFHPGASIVHNARHHAGHAIVATVDLADFFSSTTARRVRAFFLAHGWHGKALRVLMRLCTYRNSLPQGAPTSPCLSNLVNVELDGALDELARRAQATYTRYGDDLTFSWPTADLPSWFQPAVERKLLAVGYRIQPQKGWHITSLAAEPEITGVVLRSNGCIAPPRRMRAQIGPLRRRLGWLRILGGDVTATQMRLHGYQGFLHMFK